MPGYPYPIRLKAPKARKIRRPWITTPWGLVPLSLAAIGAVAHFLGPVHPAIVGAALVLPGAASRLAAEHRRRQATTAALALIAILVAHPVVAALAAGWAALQWVEPHERTRQRRRLAAIKAAWPHMAITAGVDGSRLAGVVETFRGWQLRISTAPGIPAETIAAKERQLAAAIDRDDTHVIPTSARAALMSVSERPSPLEGPALARPGEAGSRLSDGIPWAIDERGRPVTLKWGPHTLLGGATGAGKSVALSLHLIAAVSAENAHVWAIDLKGGVELAAWSDHVERVAITIEEARALLNDAVAGMNRRLEQMRLRKVTTHRPTTSSPALVLAIDELAILSEDKEATKALGVLLAQGRAAGLTIVAATQRPSTAVFGTRDGGTARSNFGRIAGFRTLRSSDADVIIGRGVHGPDGALVSLRELPQGGGHHWLLDQEGARRLRTWWYAPDAIRNSLAELPPVAASSKVDRAYDDAQDAPAASKNEGTHQGDDAGPSPMPLTVVSDLGHVGYDDVRWSLVGKGVGDMLAALNAAQEPMSARAVARAADVGDRHARMMLDRLGTVGAVARTADGWILVNSPGENTLSELLAA